MRNYILFTLLTVGCFWNLHSLAQSQNIYRFAGNGTAGFSGDGGVASAAELRSPSDVFEDALGNIYIADKGNNRIRMVNTSGIISTIVGTGTPGYTGDGGSALLATLDHPNRVFVDASENIYIADENNNVIRMVNTSGIINTIVGTGVAGFSGDGGPALSAELSGPTGVAVDFAGNIFISDYGNNRIRKVTAGVISTYAGGGGTGFTVDGVVATTLSLCGQNYVSVDNTGNIYITNYTCWHFLKVTPADLVYNVAGYEMPGFSGDCGPSDSANVEDPFGITPDNLGNVFLCPQGDIRVRRVNSLNYITSVAGDGTAGYTGDGGPAVDAEVSTSIYGIYADTRGNVYFADEGNNVIRTFFISSFADTITLCAGGTDTLTDTTSGTWVSGNTSIATVGSSTGIVTGVGSGTTVITYNIPCPQLFFVNVIAPAITGGPICQGATGVLTGSLGGGTWSSTNTTVVRIGSGTGIITGVSAGTALISYRMPGGCLATTIATVNPLPPAITGSVPFCDLTSITLADASSGGTWSSGSLGVATIVPTTGVVTGVSAGTAMISYTSVLGCITTGFVTVNPIPAAPTISGATVYCQYATYVAPVATGTNILWYTTATGGVGSPVTPVINTSIPAVYTYYVTQTTTGCESARTPFTITINPQPPPPVIVDSPANYCYGQAFEAFTIVSGTGVLWYTAATGGIGNPVSPGINTIMPGIDTVWATQTLLGCESPRVAITVQVYGQLTAGFGMVPKLGCTADTVYFNNTSTGATNYSWDFGDISPVSVATDPMHVYLSQGTYTVTLYAINPPCIDSDKQAVTLAHPLKAMFSADTNLICQGQSITFINASVATGPNYVWDFGDGSTSNVPNPTHIYPHTGVYNVVEFVTDFVPCTDSASLTISVDSTSPIYMALTDTVLCEGTYVTFTGTYSSIGNTGITWNFGNGDSVKGVNPVSYAYQTLGTFTVTASATYRVCDDTSVSRTVTILPQPEIYLGRDTSICKGGDPMTLMSLINISAANATWSWSTGATTPGIVITEPGSYTATVKVDGCSGSSTIHVSNDCYMNIPNVFTPNSDGVNDYFYPLQSLTSGLTSFSMEIYNRWGQEIFATTTIDGRGWDGKFNNVDQPEGVYVYVIDGTFKDGQKEHHTGNVTLIR